MTIPTKTYLEKCPAVSQDIDQRNIYDCNNDQHVLIADPPAGVVTLPPRPLFNAKQRFCALSLLVMFFLCTIALLLVTFDGRGHRPASFHGFCAVPYDGQGANMADANMFMQAAISGDGSGFNMANMGLDTTDERAPWMNAPSNLFYEHFDLSGGGADDAADEGYTRVTVPSFREGRSGQFLHDFKYNQSLIIDKAEGHCFVMPLDRETVLKPRNMQDLIEKMMDGYYNIDTEQLRRRMRVVIPPMADTTEVAPRIMTECIGMEIFRLEPFVGRVFKRSIDELPDSAKFAHFSGNRIVKLDLVNYPQMKQFLANRK